MKKVLIKAALALSLAVPFAANAMPITLTAGQTALFDFNLAGSASGFIISAQIDTNLSGYNPFAGDFGYATYYTGLGGSGTAFGGSLAGGTTTFAEFTDGLFSMAITAVSGSFSVNPFATGAQIVGIPYFPFITITAIPDVPGSASTPSTSVPEPGSLALFGLALAGLGFAWRRRASR